MGGAMPLGLGGACRMGGAVPSGLATEVVSCQVGSGWVMSTVCRVVSCHVA